MAVLNSREAMIERARKHARNTWDCPICGKTCRGNGGRASHMRKHVKAAGYDDDHIFGWGLRVVFGTLWRDGPHPPGLHPNPPDTPTPAEIAASLSPAMTKVLLRIYNLQPIRGPQFHSTPALARRGLLDREYDGSITDLGRAVAKEADR